MTRERINYTWNVGIPFVVLTEAEIGNIQLRGWLAELEASGNYTKDELLAFTTVSPYLTAIAYELDSFVEEYRRAKETESGSSGIIKPEGPRIILPTGR